MIDTTTTCNKCQSLTDDSLKITDGHYDWHDYMDKRFADLELDIKEVKSLILKIYSEQTKR